MEMSLAMLPVKMLPQPDETTCGPTSLHALYDFYGDTISLEDVVSQVSYLEEGGTLAVLLACHALKRGYDVTIYTYNLLVFDPTWFQKGVNLQEKLKEQCHYKQDEKMRRASDAYVEFLNLGGEIRFEDLRPSLLKKYFAEGMPILTGLSATYLYKTMREYVNDDNHIIHDDVRGHPSGHFVVLCGYDRAKRHVVVADPYRENTISGDVYYAVRVGRLLNSIMLGVITYDANFMIIRPNKKR